MISRYIIDKRRHNNYKKSIDNVTANVSVIMNNNMYHKEKDIINRVKTIVTHHKQLSQAKGELFNIYSILNLKTNEVRTHSAFITELLNPKGTHYMGTLFLKAFLEVVPNEASKHLDIESVCAFAEFSIGTINQKFKTGGRIDILLKDTKGNTLCIENKIDAGDQEYQVERYCNYNKGFNNVIYLSKFGNEPDISSKGELSKELDFHIISYQDHIIRWLEVCQTLAYDQPILRESIKQYKILIQTITNTLGNKENKELEAVVISNLEESSLIASKYNQVILEIKNNFRLLIKKLLEEKFKDFRLEEVKSVNKSYANLWFYSIIPNQNNIWFVIESFSGMGHLNGDLFVGIYDKNGINLGQNYNSLNKSWVHHQVLLHDNIKVNLSNNEFLQKISNKEQLELISVEIINQIVVFVEENKHIIR